MVTFPMPLIVPWVLCELWLHSQWREVLAWMLQPFRSWTGQDDPRKPRV